MSATVHPDGVALSLASESSPPMGGPSTTVSPGPTTASTLRARLLVDAMGGASPIARQARAGSPPDGVCLVVGTCAAGYPPEANDSSDVVATVGPLTPSLGKGGLPSQLFWEAFPAGSGPGDRTTYMFSYMDAREGRPTLEEMLEEVRAGEGTCV